MKPKRIILVRHGESEGNVNKRAYNYIPDHAIKLTSLGEQQALDAGVKLKELLKNETVAVYCSPYTRTRETFRLINKNLQPINLYREDVRLREHEWTGHLIDSNKADWERKAAEFGTTFFRFPTGESCADVFDRISSFFIDLKYDFEEKDFPENLLIVGHGMTNRVILMKLLRLTPEEFEKLANPKNAEYFVLDQNANGSYQLTHDIRKHAKTRRIF